MASKPSDKASKSEHSHTEPIMDIDNKAQEKNVNKPQETLEKPTQSTGKSKKSKRKKAVPMIDDPNAIVKSVLAKSVNKIPNLSKEIEQTLNQRKVIIKKQLAGLDYGPNDQSLLHANFSPNFTMLPTSFKGKIEVEADALLSLRCIHHEYQPRDRRRHKKSSKTHNKKGKPKVATQQQQSTKPKPPEAKQARPQIPVDVKN